MVDSPRDMLFAPRDLVRHTNGSTYCILLHCLREADSVSCYAYRDVAGGPVWIRPAGMMEDGRFTLIGRAPEPAAPDDQADLIVLMSGLLREAIDADDEDDMVSWYRRAENALSRYQAATATPTPTDDTTKPDSEPTGLSAAQTAICRECDAILNLLLEKNRRYGNSALEPVRVFSRADPVEQIRVRIDDKLSRMASRQVDDDEDVTLDLIGYLILLRIARQSAANPQECA